MIINRFKEFFFAMLLWGLSILMITACTDNPVDSGEAWDHVPAVGFDLEMEGKLVLRYFLRQYTFDPQGLWGDLVVEDPEVTAGGFIRFRREHLEPVSDQTSPFTIFYLDEHGQRLPVPEYYVDGKRSPEGEYYLKFEYMEPDSRTRRIEDPDKLPYVVIYDETDGETWKFQLQARHSGRADLRINLWHIDHYDFTPLPLPIVMDLD